MSEHVFSKLGAKPIWLDCNKKNHYVDFKTSFTVNKVDSDAKLYIAVDTEYAVFLNGQFVDMGAYDDFPDDKVYDTLDVVKYLKEGENELFILGYAQGIGSFQYIEATPFIMFSLVNGEQVINSDESIICRENPNYQSDEVDLLSFQTGYIFIYDASKESEDWKHAVLVDESTISASFKERPIKKCVFEEKTDSIITAQGKFLRKSDKDAPIYTHMKEDYLSTLLPQDLYTNRVTTGKDEGVYNNIQLDEDVIPSNVELKNGKIRTSATFEAPKDADGIYLLVDIQKMQSGLLNLELEAGKGTQIEISYGEVIDDLRVRSYLVKSVCKYTCKDGYQNFTTFLRRCSGRYIQLHFTNITKPVTMHYMGIIPMLYPVKLIPFKSNDRLFQKIHEVAVHTLRTCMHEHYEDCPLREQGLYGFDGLNQMVAGYYAFEGHEMQESCIRLLGQGQMDNGLIPLVAPASYSEPIPMFSFAWVQCVYQFVAHTGQLELAKDMMPNIQKLLATFEGWIKNGVIQTPFWDTFPTVWHFYDWEYGLEDTERIFHTNEGKVRIDAPLNFAFCLSLKFTIELMEKIGGYDNEVAHYTELYNTIAKNAHDMLYDSEKGLYKTFIGGSYENHYCELSQALALYSGISNDDALRAKLADKDNGMIKTNLSFMYYKYQALLQDSEKHLPFILDEIAELWGNMLYNKATTFWETTRGSEDFSKSASLCHGWSALPVYIFKKYLDK